ncbi:CDGSH iron-sulfur domain-containing protein [uncultured Bacteroides sp.]|uniref:CDGSH iron-sulfur domain-containing protein n=1 Tax=uncultured Bacteroides sp. TaxID=162156 RepID=UPI002AA8DE86|nr:CDGSH iron-sulfur domain-containing protein [uncultured Bacteroides sp.]
MDKKDDLVAVKESAGGPYIIKGEFKLTTKNGKESTLTGMNALCRCGHSKSKPFCDGSHQKVGFEKE